MVAATGIRVKPRQGEAVAPTAKPALTAAWAPTPAWTGPASAATDRLVPPEWHENLGFNYFWINEQIESGAFLGKQLDWGAWGIEVTQADALAIWEGRKDDYPHANWKERWAKIKSQIEALDVGKQYVIVVAEEP